MKSNNVSSGGGVGFAGLLTIVFIILKLTHVIDWSWVWVLSPLMIQIAVLIILIIIWIALELKVNFKKIKK